MTTYHTYGGAVVRTSPGVPGSNPRWNFFLLFSLIRPIIITLIKIFTVGGAWVWLFRVYVYNMGVISGRSFCLVYWLACYTLSSYTLSSYILRRKKNKKI